VPVHDRTIDQAPAVTTTATADEPMLRGGGRATPSELVAKETPRGPEIKVDGLFRPKANTAAQVVPR
jgi:hypothetical protein